MTQKIQQLTFNRPESSRAMTDNFFVSDTVYKNDAISFEHPFVFDGIVFSICLRGTGRVQINFREYTISKNSIITILPNQIVQIVERSEDFLVETLSFSPDYMIDMAFPKGSEIPGRIISMPVLTVAGKEAEEILGYYTFIATAFNERKHLFSKYVIKGLLYSLLMELSAKYVNNFALEKRKPSGRSEEIVEQFFMLLTKYHKKERSASFYAGKQCITAKYLSGTLKKVTGRSINLWIEDVIVLSSKILLKSSDMTVLQISEELNFPNPSYFGRFFKKLTGMTPREYRNK